MDASPLVESHGGMINRRKLLIHPPELSGNPTNSHLVANERNLAKEMMNLAFEISLFILHSDFLHASRL
jgi:hypothetical protein